MTLSLSSSQLKDFYEVGFIVIENVFTPAEVRKISDAADRLKDMAQELSGMVLHKGSQFVLEKSPDNSHGKTRIKRIVWCGSAEPVLLRFGQDLRLTKIAGQILESTRLQHLINQIHYKQSHDHVFFPFHQDSTHRGYGTPDWHDINGKGSYVQMAIAIDPVTKDNGPLLFIPGSCRKGHLNLPYDENLQTQSPHINANDAVSLVMNPGSMVVFGPYTIHGSLPNNSDTSRRVFINGFAYPGANFRKYPGEGSGMYLTVPSS